MNNEYVNSLREKVKNALVKDEARFRHTLGVADTCACLAIVNDVDMERAYIAGLLHDCAKCVPDDVKIKDCQDNGLSISDIEMSNPYLLHSKLGALYANKIYGIEDKEICSSIEWHTTGKPNMTKLEQIVFVADYIEPLRDKQRNLEIVRKTSFENLNLATYYILRDTLEFLNRKGRAIDFLTVDTFEYYKQLIDKGDLHA